MNHSANRSSRGGPILLALGVLVVLGLGLGLPSVAAADNEAGNLEFVVLSDDIRKTVTQVERPDGADAADAGKNNNGHGNNLDGVDSSNPGQGGGGPNGAIDASGELDDEAGGGGAAPSKGKKK